MKLNKNIKLQDCGNCNNKHTYLKINGFEYVFSYDSLLAILDDSENIKNDIEKKILFVSKEIANYSLTSKKHFKCCFRDSISSYEKKDWFKKIYK